MHTQVDTREKIWPLEALPALFGSDEWLVTVGQFDPLTAMQAKRLHALATSGRKLLAIVLEDDGALLSANARAALIAALRDVDAVTVAEAERWRDAIPNAARVGVVEDADGEKTRSAEFIRYIVERQAAASGAGQSQ